MSASTFMLAATVVGVALFLIYGPAWRLSRAMRAYFDAHVELLNDATSEARRHSLRAELPRFEAMFAQVPTTRLERLWLHFGKGLPSDQHRALGMTLVSLHKKGLIQGPGRFATGGAAKVEQEAPGSGLDRLLEQYCKLPSMPDLVGQPIAEILKGPGGDIVIFRDIQPIARRHGPLPIPLRYLFVAVLTDGESIDLIVTIEQGLAGPMLGTFDPEGLHGNHGSVDIPATPKEFFSVVAQALGSLAQPS